MSSPYPENTGSLAQVSGEEKKKRLDAMVKIWQSDTQQRYRREDKQVFYRALGLDEYRYSVWLRFPEWERMAVVGQVVAQPRSGSVASTDPLLFSSWRKESLLRTMPDWKLHLPRETVFTISVRITPGSLGEGSKWATVMPKELIPRYRPGWPTQQEWVAWTRSFDWLAIGIGFVHAMLKEI